MDERAFVLARLGCSNARHELGAPVGALFERSLGRLASHGDFPRFLDVARGLECLSGTLTLDAVAPGREGEGEEARATLEALRSLAPWRKGPFRFGALFLDAEWRSDRKWERLAGFATPFEGRRVLDVGSGNGYYLLRLVGAGARFALGVEPSVLYTSQFLALASVLAPERVAHLPLPLEEWTAPTPAFDTVLSMGVLYHRRDPNAHLRLLGEHLRDDGELIVETLTYEEPGGDVLRPTDRYAKMRNVFAIPSPPTLVAWLTEADFTDIELSEPVPTTTDEQRSTEFSEGPSLADFLAPTDPTKTVEGHPAPVRRLARARKRR